MGKTHTALGYAQNTSRKAIDAAARTRIANVYAFSWPRNSRIFVTLLLCCFCNFFNLTQKIFSFFFSS
ncbi:MAG TPA: hypothetical protein DD376_03315 [Sutterella sp.]|nr:hypothetical protein [Sutterella sp.]